MDKIIEKVIQNIPNFNFFVSPLNGEIVSEVLEIANNGVIHHTKLEDKDWSPHIVKAETHLFYHKSMLESLADSSAINNDASSEFKIEDYNYLKKENYDFYAKTDGILIQSGQLIKFIPIIYDGYCEIHVSENKEIAMANIYPAVSTGKNITAEYLIGQIRVKGISVNLDIEAIKKAVEEVSKSNKQLIDIIVAKGKPVVSSVEGRIEYLFDTEKSGIAVIDENGHTDFHNRNLLVSVSKNQIVAIYHPMIEGENGIDVYGGVITVPKVKDIKIPRGQNIYSTEEEPNNILSKIDGYITLSAGSIIVTNVYNLRGDVDFNTGHIISKGSLNITGNVISGFNLEMSENIKIMGYVNDSIIKTGGDVSIQGGFTGTGIGKIVSGGNVCARYIRNQTVYSRGSITVDKEVVDAQLFAKDDIKAKNNEAVIIGGKLVAGGNITVSTIGHEYGMTTLLEVGYDYDLINKIKEIDIKLMEARKELAALKAQIQGKMSAGFLMEYQNKKNIVDELFKEKNNCKGSISSLSGSKITVSGKIYPGVKMIIDGYKLDINEMLVSKVFYASQEEEGIVIANR